VSAPWQLLPALTAEEFAALKADVAEHGVLVPIVIDADSGSIIDGHHRLQAWTELRAEGLRVPDYPREVRRFATDEERIEFVVAANLFRRHLTRPQRAEVVTRLRAEGRSLRRIGEVVGADPSTVLRDLSTVGSATVPERSIGRDGRSRPARRPSIVVGSAREQARAETALRALGDEAPPKLLNLGRAEERARMANLERLRSADVPPKIEGDAFELRCGDLREVLADLPDHLVDAIVTDPPYDEEGIPLYEDLGRLAARVLKPGRLAAVYCGHLHLDEEMGLLAQGGLTYMWHGVNVLPGQHTKVRLRKVNGRHRSVLLYSAGMYRPRRWVHDLVLAEGRGGPDERPLHPWQQALEPVRHWIRQVSEPGELIVDPFLGSGTTAVAAVLEGRRFLGCDLDPGCVETTRRRLEQLEEERLVVAVPAAEEAE
jgi:site-specific DNA-methyltransferase (adenine-specific)